jgi:excisionase family DNA binding protein
MNKSERIQSRIDELIAKTSRNQRQYDAAKWQEKALTEAGLIDYMPRGWGSTDGNIVCEDACIGKYAYKPATEQKAGAAYDEVYEVHHKLAQILAIVEDETEQESDSELNQIDAMEEEVRARQCRRCDNDAEGSELCPACADEYQKEMEQPEGIVWEVLTITEAADEFGISREAVEKAIRSNRLSARKSGATWLFRREDAAALWNHVAQVGAVLMVIAVGLIAYL